ncbi:MAG: MFS transporter, partial [Pseudonocardia sp.]
MSRSQATQATTTAPGAMLALATIGFTVTFWGWALLSPLGATLRDQLSLSSVEQSLLVAVPVVVGSLGRIPVGVLTDRLGARLMFPAVALLTILPVLYLGHLADSLGEYLVGGFFLGLGGTTFAIGVPFVNSWYPPARRGLAIGVFGAGMGGTAISAFTTVQLADAVGPAFPFDLVAIALAIYAVVGRLLLRDRPDRVVPSGSATAGFVAALRMPVTLQLSFLYAVAFGGFVAFSVYLPTYLGTAHGLAQSDAALRTAGFVVLAVAMRPVGGWLSDRLGPVPVLTATFACVAVLAVVASFEFPLTPARAAVFLTMAAALGA